MTPPFFICDLPRGRSGHIGEWLLEDSDGTEIERAHYSDLEKGDRKRAYERLSARRAELEKGASA